MERLGLVLGNIVLRDDAVSPPAKWRIQGLTIEAGDLTTRAGQPAGRLAIQSKVGDSPFELSSNEIRLAPGAVSLGLSIKDFDLTQILPYVPPTAPAGPYAGRLGFNLRISFERGNEGVTRAVVTGDAGLDALQLIRRDGPAPFMTVFARQLGAVAHRDCVVAEDGMVLHQRGRVCARGGHEHGGHAVAVAGHGMPSSTRSSAAPSAATCGSFTSEK